jgi:Arc-like DNA binding domain
MPASSHIDKETQELLAEVQPQPEKNIKVTVRIPEHIVKNIKKSAKQHFRNFNGELVFALQQYLHYGKDSTNNVYASK